MIDPVRIAEAAELLRRGRLVAFPTETVYGLGADAAQETAVQEIFRVKGRPADHPLIVHLGESKEISQWALEVPAEAKILAGSFWPGPLTLIFRKAPEVLDVVTGGQDTVGLRIPSHPVALALLREFGGGVAAPSANRFGQVSPTSAEHVRRDLGGDVAMILDGGPCAVGVESTIVDLSSGPPAILRPGGVTRERIEEALGRPVEVRTAGRVRVSGQLDTHYAPRARVVLASADELEARAAEFRSRGLKVSVLTPSDLEPQKLYASLRTADEEKADVILAALPPETELGLAVVDRLRKAAGPREGHPWRS